MTQGSYQACVEAGVCEVPGVEGYDPQGKWNWPIEVTWSAAQAYCVWAGGRLPTEAEWEKAARGIDARTYPWGDEEPDCSRANHDSLRQGWCFAGLAPVGSFPAGASPYGALDMAGNAGEWVNDWYGADYYAVSPEQNPLGPESGEYRVARGNSWIYPAEYIRAACRDPWTPDEPFLGFRCVAPAPSATIVESDLFEGWYRYTNLDYGFSFHHPPDWTLEERPHQVMLRHRVVDTLQFTLHYRRAAEDIGIWRTGMPAGDFVPRGSVQFLGQEISRDVLVYEGKDKLVLYNYSSAIPWGDIVFDPVLEDGRVDYEAVDLSEETQRQIDQVIASFELKD